MKLRFTPRALADLGAIADYLAQRNPQGARRVRAAILRCLQNLALFPYVGRRQNVAAVRKISVGRYPYLIYYTVDEVAEEIAILTIQHGARKREFIDR